jgi:tetratricopeptide (TPR) repeat protein
MTLTYSVRLITFCTATVLPFTVAFGQNKTGTPPTPPSSTGTTGNIPTRTTIPNTQPQPTTPQPQRPIFITGRVLTEDGQPPEQAAKIERVCNGNAHGEGFTDSKGYFSIQLGGQMSATLQDASEAGPGFDGPDMMGSGRSSSMNGNSTAGSQFGGIMGDRRWQNCDIRAQVAGYRSQQVSLAMRMPMDNPDIGIILLHRLGPNESGTVVSALSLAAPKDAKKAFNKGMDALKKKKQDQAVEEFQKAVAEYPDYALAWCELGKVQAAGGHMDQAKDSFDHAVKADPKFVDPYLQLSLLALRAQKWNELADLTGKASQLDSFDYPQLFLFNAVANYNLQHVDLAEKSIERAEHLDTRHQYPQIAHLYGVILLDRQNYSGAAERLRTYLKLAPNAPDEEKVKEQLSEIEKAMAANPPAAPAAAPKQQ